MELASLHMPVMNQVKSVQAIPYVTLSSTENENPGHDMPTEEAGSTQLSFTSSSPAAITVDASCFYGSVPSYPISQMQSEVCLEPESTSLRSEVMLIKFPVPQSTLADEHFKDVSTTSQGEAVSSTSNSLHPDLEDGTLNEKRLVKLQRPRTPLIDAVAAHDRSMLKKVKERPQPKVPKVEDRDSLLQQILTKWTPRSHKSYTRRSLMTYVSRLLDTSKDSCTS